jgi:hypothetical protein
MFCRLTLRHPVYVKHLGYLIKILNGSARYRYIIAVVDTNSLPRSDVDGPMTLS